MLALSRRMFVGGALSLCFGVGLGAQENPRPRSSTPPVYQIFDTPPATHTLSRRDVVVDGQGYRLFMAIPNGDAPATGWPSLWMLDGNSAFDRMTSEDLAAHPGLAVIGIGYPVDQAFDTNARSLDYTPKSAEPLSERDRRRPTGGAETFRTRLLGPLRQTVEAEANLDPARRVLWGHSYGGLFTLYCLLSEPQAFAGWVPVSPSSGFSGNALRHMLAQAPQLEGNDPAPVHIMLGDSEHRSGTDAPAQPRPAPETMALADLLKQRADLDVTVTVFNGLGHGQTFAASFATAMDLAEGLHAT